VSHVASNAEKRIRRIALATTLLLNLLFVVVLHFGTKPHGGVTRFAHPLIVRLIAPIEKVPPIDVSEPVPPPHATRARSPHEIAARQAASGGPETKRAFVAPTAESPLHLFDTTGRIILPESETALHESPTASTDRLARVNPLPYQPTRFDRYFPPVDETLGGEIVRKTTITQTWVTPWGTQVTCSSSLVLAMLVICDWRPAPRLSIEELQHMRADPPPSKNPPDN
jgi:hypothetical protein